LHADLRTRKRATSARLLHRTADGAALCACGSWNRGKHRDDSKWKKMRQPPFDRRSVRCSNEPRR
jgi:hypothetical protein